MTATNLTPAELKAQTLVVLQLVKVLADTVREAGPDGAPEGPLYAAFMSHGLGLDGFSRMVDMLVKARLVRKVGYVLHWTGEA